ncbi:MAG: patatin-like phospholipase family protein [Clostridia bacterium]|nr:patatin-like phospholipase family protein [Clostridia bacterium]
MKKLALVLGGGATKGYAHIGILQVLEKHNIKPDLIVGTSMGAIIGGAYACGKTCEHLISISQRLTRKNLMDFNLLNPFFTTAVFSGKKLKKLLHGEIGDTTHNETEIPFVAVATNLDTGKLEVIKEGLVVDSMLASSAIPGVFPIIEHEGAHLCDGGVLNNVPDDVARKLRKNYVILSVDVIADYAKQVESSRFKILGVTINALTLMQSKITKLKENNSDIKISISQPDVAQMSFDVESAKKSISYGASAMNKNIEKLKKMLQD